MGAGCRLFGQQQDSSIGGAASKEHRKSHSCWQLQVMAAVNVQQQTRGEWSNWGGGRSQAVAASGAALQCEHEC